MKFYTLTFVLLVSCFAVVAQPFVPLTTSLPAIGRSAMAFADFDNDTDLDLVMIGLDATSNTLAKVFLNQEGIFIEVQSGISGLYNSAIAVADYDLDGYMDIVMTGRNSNGNATFLYRNTGNASFELIEAGFYEAGTDGDLAWGDYNNDGYPDLVISGGWDTKLYSNNGDGSFIEINSGLTIMNSPSLSWGDCDNDGDSDLLMVGDAGSVAETFIYLNNQGTFSRLEADIEGAVGGSARWGDYDNDGNLDFLITGKDTSLIPVSFVYHNNGNKTFSFANVGLVGTALGPADWIDYDNDGDLDIMLAGENAGCGNASTLLYNNDGVGGFNQVQAGLPFIERASSVWGDYDNDGDFDLILSGLVGDPATFFFRNDLLSGPYQPNMPPSVPDNLYTYVSGDYAVVGWARSSDLQTPQMAVSYNVMVGTEPGGIDVVSPQSDITTGMRYSVSSGNTGNNDFMIFRCLVPGDYYFKIQAIDQAFAGSGFSEEGSFTVLSTGLSQKEIEKSAIFTTGSLLRVLTEENGESELFITSVTGRTVWSGKFSGNDFSLALDDYSVGVYIVNLKTSGKQVNVKIVR